MKTKIIEWIMIAVLIGAVAGAGYLAYQTIQAEKFCQDKGHDTGRYKGNGGAHYSCMDFTKYRIEDGKN